MSAMLFGRFGRTLQHGLPIRNKLSNPNWAKLSIVNQQQKRFLDLQEYQSKQLLHEHGVQVQRFKVVSDVEDAERVLLPELHDLEVVNKGSRWSGFEEDISGASEFVVKAQVLAGGRGKGIFQKSGLLGGVKLTEDKNLALEYTAKMLNDTLVTKQTTSDGVLVEKVMIAEAVRLSKEFYFAIVLDRSYDNGLIFVASPYGGVEIEEVAARNKDAIRRFTIPIDLELDIETARRTVVAAFDLNMHELDIIDQCAREIMKLHSMFLKLDASQVEINPLGVTNHHKVICVDAKIKFDENARFRQKWLDELEEMNKSEVDQRDYEARKHNLNFIGLDGSIGCLVNGAGLAMATMDIIKLHGGEPANFLDVGGGASANQVTEAFKIISSDSKVQAIFVNIFGGIMRCDIIAEGIVQATKNLNLQVPVICRLQGTRVEDAHAIIRNSHANIITMSDLDDAAKYAVSCVNKSK